MRVSLIDLKIQGVKTFADDTFYINLRNEKRRTASDVDDNTMTTMAGSNYRHNVIVLAGVNASGKTTALKLIEFALRVFILGDSLNPNKDLIELFKNEVKIKAHLLMDNTLICLTADIIKNIEDEASPVHLSFKEERFVYKTLKVNESHRSFLDFSISEDEQIRSNLDEFSSKFLKDDDSMIPSFFPEFKNLNPSYINSAIESMKNSYLMPYGIFPEELYTYLDSSIEEFSEITDDSSHRGSPKFRLKFHGEEPIIAEFTDLDRYLSSGTIRGLNILSQILFTFFAGGYLLIDELEIHFNKVIVENIISFFQSEVNKNGATLIFSTHYSEILDKVKRKDAIKVLRKNIDGIKIDSLALLAKSKDKDRTDVKNSDLILSGIFKTAPSFEQYWKVRKMMGSLAARASDKDEVSIHEE